MSGLRPRIEIQKCLFYDTGTYNPMYHRPYTTNADGQSMGILADMTRGGQQVSAATVARVASSIISPTTAGERLAVIDNGFDTARFRFLMDITINSGGGTRIRKILTGYTDHPGATHTGAIDPHMCMYVNNVITMRETQIGTAHGIQTATNVSGVDQILMGRYSDYVQGDRDYTLRPEDVYRSMQLPALINQYAQVHNVVNATSTFMGGPLAKAKRSNYNPAQYVSKMLKADQQARAISEGGTDTLDDVYENASALISEGTVREDQVLVWFSNQSDYHQSGFITWGQLLGVCPHLDSVTKILKYGGVHAKSLGHTVGQTEHWHGQNRETLIATQLSTSIPSMLMEGLIGFCAFTFTNETVTMEPVMEIQYEPMPMCLVDNYDIRQSLDAFRIRFLVELANGITCNNEIGVSIFVVCDVYGDTKITVRVNSQPPVDFVSPTFADQTFSPLITGVYGALERAAADFGRINQQIQHFGGFAAAPTAPQQQPAIYTGSSMWKA